MIGDLGGVIDHIVVSGLDQETFFAKIVMTASEKTIAVDSRPSDAVVLAARFVRRVCGGHDDRIRGRARLAVDLRQQRG